MPKLITSRLVLNAKKGFTLIELMVAISIVAILATVGLVVFSNTQIQARNSRRTQDIAAIAGALESAKQPGQAYYTQITAANFSGNLVPDDPKSTQYHYCLYYKITLPPPAPPTAVIPDVSGWNTTTCPALENPNGITTQVFGTTNVPEIAPFATSWVVCAYQEGTPASFKCVANKQ